MDAVVDAGVVRDVAAGQPAVRRVHDRAAFELRDIALPEIQIPTNGRQLVRARDARLCELMPQIRILHLQEFIRDCPRRAHVHQSAQQDLLPLRLPRDLLPAAGRPLPQKRLY